MKKAYFILFCVIFYSSCRDEIDLSAKAEQLTGISIQSQLTKGNPSIITVDIQRVFTFSAESRKTLPISEVILEDDLGNEILLKNDRVGFYFEVIPESHPTFKVDYDRQYRIKAVVDNKRYESNFEAVLPVPKMESLSFEIFEKEIRNTIGDLSPRNFARFRVNTPVGIAGEPEKSRFKWNLFRVFRPANDAGTAIEGCLTFGSPDFSHLEVVDGNRLASDTVSNLTIFETLIQFSYGDTYFLMVQQESLSETAYDYWTEVATVSDRDGSQFQPAIGVIGSNFKNVDDEAEDVYGYFYASARDVMLIKACLNNGSYELSRYPESRCDFQLGVPAGFWEECR